MLIGDEILTIEGKDLEECRKILFERYGTSYSIVERKVITKPSFFGLRQTHAMRVSYRLNKTPVEPEVPRPEPVHNRYSPQNIETDFVKNRDELIRQAAGSSSVTQYIHTAQMSKKNEEEFSKINEKLNLMMESLEAKNTHPSIKRIEEMLSDNDFSNRVITSVTERMQKEFSLEELNDFEGVQKTVVDWIGNQIRIAPITLKRPPQVIILVGPTGVGKTTTIAKLAANIFKTAKMEQRPRPVIKFLSVDQFRVGAFAQMNKYANALESDFLTADSPEQVLQIYNESKDNTDYIFIDTSGFSPNDSENLGKMKTLLCVDKLNPTVYLAFDATKTSTVLKDVMQNFEQFGYESVIVTKCDEATRLGAAISALIEKRKSIAYVCFGQRAKHDISKATKQYFLKRLYNFEINPVHLDDLFPEEK